MKKLLVELFENYYKDIYTYLYSLCRDASLSEDLASEVFLEVVKPLQVFVAILISKHGCFPLLDTDGTHIFAPKHISHQSKASTNCMIPILLVYNHLVFQAI